MKNDNTSPSVGTLGATPNSIRADSAPAVPAETLSATDVMQTVEAFGPPPSATTVPLVEAAPSATTVSMTGKIELDPNPPEEIPLRNIEGPSQFSRSYDAGPPRGSKVSRLAASIEEIGLVNPIILSKVRGKPGFFRVVAGHHRVLALQYLRGKGGVLRREEFKPLGVYDDAPQLLRYSADENLNEDGSSVTPFELMHLVAHVHTHLGVPQADIAAALALDIPTVDLLIRAERVFESLPRLTQECLRCLGGVMDSGDSAAATPPCFTLAHLVAVVPVLENAEKPKKVLQAIGKATQDAWSPDRLLAKISPAAKRARKPARSPLEKVQAIFADGRDRLLKAKYAELAAAADALIDEVRKQASSPEKEVMK